MEANIYTPLLTPPLEPQNNIPERQLSSRHIQMIAIGGTIGTVKI